MSSAPTPAATADPWERFGWLMGAIWLVFLAFPIVAIATSDEQPVWRVLGICGILAFGASYLRGFFQISSQDTWDLVVRTGVRYLVLLALITLALTPLVGLGALAHLPYIVALGMFSLPLAWAFGLAGAAILTAILVPLVVGALPETWYFILIITLVAISTGLVRVFEERGHAHRAAQADLALAAERDRVARDVHDVLGHSLTVVTVKAELAQRLIDTDPARAHEELEQIQALSRVALAEIRATVSGLRVASLADELAAADSALADAGVQAELPENLDVVDPRHRVLLAWVLREAVTNVVRHSGASLCTVELGSDLLRVTDDGKGTGGRREGNGLRGIRERVCAAGGTLTLAPGPAGGTVLEVTLD
ncbi:sensor histidine kinase [Ornithinimicrobium sp. F0845]|uniref:sensor histidine kinase n=1 Tax=Ornithinimicrobium sp. F0845 TaxID=2926412 RepID=UPI001FF60F1D|nr:sensor histidine kinase [Ornithinimicrobium sp. F0845]MCK0112235.1 sensor histidine kinase [Ornithinimicrobium sp. F0845]